MLAAAVSLLVATRARPSPAAADRMSMLVLAHAGHWLAQLAYLAPLLLLVGMLAHAKWRARRQSRAKSRKQDAE